jgi:class 3 adenylate cyclase
MGKGVHVAARIAAHASAGEILTSAASLPATRYPVEELGPVALKGLDEPVELVRVRWDNEA